MKIDGTIIATRRPELLDLTLRSYYQNLFSRGFFPSRTFLNIDPVWGTEEDADEVERIARRYFDVLIVRRPETPSFGGAVKWAWSQTDADWVLHMEDDWLMTRRVDVSRLVRTLLPTVGQIALNNGSLLKRSERGDVKSFISSPCIMNGNFAKIAAFHMNPDLDPEKQYFQGFNPEGSTALKDFQNRYFGELDSPRLLKDLGHSWRRANGFDKVLQEGRTFWIKRAPRRKRYHRLVLLWARALLLLAMVRPET